MNLTTTPKSSSSYQFLQRIAAGCDCCICKNKLTNIRDFRDPRPLAPLILQLMQERGEQIPVFENPENSRPEDNLFVCRECFASFVGVARARYINRERDIIYNMPVKEDFQDAYLLDEDLENGCVRMLRYKGVTHHTTEKFNIACTGEKIESRGKAARSARIGAFSELECPVCRKQILSSMKKDLSNFFPDPKLPGMDA